MAEINPEDQRSLKGTIPIKSEHTSVKGHKRKKLIQLNHVAGGTLIIKHLHAATVGLIAVVRAAVQTQCYSVSALSLSRCLEENSTLL